MDTSVLQVEWLGDNRVKPEVVGLSDGGREACVSLEKSCDFVAAQWVYPSI